ncbi:MAG: hypothetical protein ACI82H_000090 [Alphaproteobacteria bacterium]|jgi:hypothetical protein
MTITVLRNISGGQTGVDRAALDAAQAAGLQCGGFCPKGRAAEDGPIHDRYPLSETAAIDPAVRTRANIESADATLILVMDDDRRGWGPGTRLTEQHAQHLSRAVHLTVLGDGINGRPPILEALEETQAWIVGHGVRALNVAGPRESTSPGIYQHAHAFLTRLFAASS